MARKKKQWFLTRDEEDKVKDLVTNLFASSWRAGRACTTPCPDYANGFGVLQGLRELGLLEIGEMYQWIRECRQKSFRDFKKEAKK